MEDRAFDRVTRFIGESSRRDALRAIFAAGLFGHFAAASDAKKRQKKKKCRGSRPNRCGKKCTSLKADRANCGQCGTRCDDGETCVNGNCSCGEGRIVCGGACLEGDCCDGERGVSCGSGEQCCQSIGCKNHDTDPRHCGACGNACNDEEICSNGSCTCGEGRFVCGEHGCKNLQTDEAHCGECGHACFDGEECIAGQCVCGLGSIVCGDVCDVGGCCQNGNPVTCGDGLSCCGQQGCVDLRNDPLNCGDCGIACSGSSNGCFDEICKCKGEGAEPEICSGGEVCRTDGCVCFGIILPGECGCKCPDGQACLEGKGRCECPPNQAYFEGTCQTCPAPPGPGLPSQGTVCPGEFCSCGGGCCGEAGDCFVTENREGQPISEFCCSASEIGGTVCGDDCCSNADCETAGCVRISFLGRSYRRPGR